MTSSPLIYVLMSSATSMTVEGIRVKAFEVLDGGVLRIDNLGDGGRTFYSPHEWRRVHESGGATATVAEFSNEPTE